MISRKTSIAGVALATAVLGTATAPGSARQHAAPKRITGEGVGQVKLGKTHSQLREQGLVGPLRPGCELGANTRSATLKAPLQGFVDYSTMSPRRVASITISGGARARGIGIGATIPQIKAKFPHAKVFHGLEEMFRLTTVKIPGRDGGVFRFYVDVGTDRTVRIGVPFLPVCE